MLDTENLLLPAPEMHLDSQQASSLLTLSRSLRSITSSKTWRSPSLKHRQRAPDFYVNFSQASLPRPWTAPSLSLSAAATKPHVPNLSHLRRPPRCQHSSGGPRGAQPPPSPGSAASPIRGPSPRSCGHGPAGGTGSRLPAPGLGAPGRCR